MLSPADLLGSWRLERRVLDRTSGSFGHMSGTFTLTTVDAGIRWREQGVFVFAGRGYESSRELLLRPEPDGGWTMCFADGREFHPWQPGAVVSHACREDLYRGLLDVTPDRLRTIWDVTGPAKHQRLITRCTRC